MKNATQLALLSLMLSTPLYARHGYSGFYPCSRPVGSVRGSRKMALTSLRELLSELVTRISQVGTSLSGGYGGSRGFSAWREENPEKTEGPGRFSVSPSGVPGS